jgi:hypothetical protein
MIRTVIQLEDNTLTLILPENFRGKQVEIIAFTVDEVEAGSNEYVEGEEAIKTFSALELDTRGYTFNREEANER